MKKSCKYCGFIHQVGYECPRKPSRNYKLKYKEKDKFRSSYIWQRKREEIKQRDFYLCRACMDQVINIDIKYNAEELSVHHIVPLEVDYSLRLENDNLITLCDMHHKQAEKGDIDANYLRKLINDR
jgi:5-methylcytosine-specific restriction endonuclease McrA